MKPGNGAEWIGLCSQNILPSREVGQPAALWLLLRLEGGCREGAFRNVDLPLAHTLTHIFNHFKVVRMWFTMGWYQLELF